MSIPNSDSTLQSSNIKFKKSNGFLQLDPLANPEIRYGDFRWHAEEIARTRGLFALTIEPTDMETPSDALLERIALFRKELNEMGVPIFLRYGHEMNGDWTSYGIKPVAYVNGFRRMATAMRKHTNMTGISN